MVTAPQSNDPKYLHQRAEEARAHTKQMSNAREMMLEIANEYDDLAEKAAVRAADETKEG